MGARQCDSQVSAGMKPLRLVLVVMAVLACTRAGQPQPMHKPLSSLEVLGTEGSVSMAKVRLGPSETFRFEASACQEVLVFVERGSARLGLTRLETGRAARFQAPTLVQGMSDDGTVIFAVAALSDEAPIDRIDWAAEPTDPTCLAQSKELTLSDPSRSGPFVHADGRLSVMIYLDGVRDRASLGTLSGDQRLGVPEHVHDGSAEVLWIQNGSGTMRIGNQTRTIRPGTFVYVPPETVHGFVPDGSRPLFAFQVYTPSGPEQRFRQSVLGLTVQPGEARGPAR